MSTFDSGLKSGGKLILCSNVLCAQKLSEGTAEQPSMQSVTAGKQSEALLSQGWAIRQTKNAARFNENQRSYLDEKFRIGQSTGIKADPSQVACELRNARTESGKRRLSTDEFLTPLQSKSYFSRKAAKTKQVVADKEATELAQKDHQTYSSVRETIIRECKIEHPIMCDTYDVCKLYSGGKLTKLNIALLRHFFFSMDVDGLSQHRKAPYTYISISY